MSSETESMRALAAEAKETVVLTRQFYSCVVKDHRHSSGEFQAKPATPLPDDLQALVKDFVEKS
jgi:hypothetical protein